jgi:hypothetical protein
LRPDWSSAEFAWLVDQARRRRSAGPLNFRAVRDSSGARVGAYAFYGERNAVARVLHATATEKSWGGVLSLILETTRSMGCIGVHGSTRRGLLSHVYSVPGMFFYYGGGTMVYSHHADVNAALDEGAAFVGGFAGDRWSRLGTDRFD